MYKLGIFGLSASGKSTFTAHLEAQFSSVLSVSSSELIKRGNGVTQFSLLDEKTIDENQILLLKGLQEIENSEKEKDILAIELHAYIESNDCATEVSDDVFSTIGLDAIFFIENSPELIYKRRLQGEKLRPKSSLNFIEKLQKMSESKLLNFAKRERIPLFKEELQLTRFIRSIS